MLTRHTVVAIATVLTLPCWPARAQGQESVGLVRDGVATAVLVLPTPSHADEELAARELQEHIEKMSGAVLGKVRGSAPEGRIPIRIGPTLNGSDEDELRAFSHDPAAFAISVAHDGVTLAGLSPEGTLFAAYEMLEQIGVRWYMPGDLGTVVPERRTIGLPLGQMRQAPSFPHRHLQTISRELPWYRRQRLGGLSFPGAHGVGLLPAADFQTEPELYALIGGERRERQLCVSHPEVARRATAYAIDFFDRHPESPWIGMGPRDGRGYCECEACRALDSGEWDAQAAEYSMTDRYVWLFNQILAGVHEKHPGKKLGFYAYSTHQLPPRRQRPNAHIVPAFAPINLCRIHGLSNPVCPDRSFYRTLMVDPLVA